MTLSKNSIRGHGQELAYCYDYANAGDANGLERRATTIHESADQVGHSTKTNGEAASGSGDETK